MSECSRLRGHEGYGACDDVFHVKHSTLPPLFHLFPGKTVEMKSPRDYNEKYLFKLR